jgi:hypothetical protein
MGCCFDGIRPVAQVGSDGWSLAQIAACVVFAVGVSELAGVGEPIVGCFSERFGFGFAH